jgi:hypothetical protein
VCFEGPTWLISKLWHLLSQVGKRLGFLFFMEAKVSIGTRVQDYSDFVAGVTLQGEFGAPEDEFSVTGSMMATRAIAPKSCFGSGVLHLTPCFGVALSLSSLVVMTSLSVVVTSSPKLVISL